MVAAAAKLRLILIMLINFLTAFMASYSKINFKKEKSVEAVLSIRPNK